ncbi:hypothetical protein ACLB1Q_35785 [Escherichia coli]
MEWLRVVLFGKLAESGGEYLRKGAGLHRRSASHPVVRKDNGTTRYVTEILLIRCMMMLASAECQTEPRGNSSAVILSRNLRR